MMSNYGELGKHGPNFSIGSEKNEVEFKKEGKEGRRGEK